MRLLLRKLGPAEHERYANFILPKNPRDVSFVDAIGTLTQIFDEQSSLLNTRYQCLQICKRESDDFITYTGTVNEEWSRFQLSSLSEDQFECPIFICCLQSPIDADIRNHLLTKIQQDPKTTLQMLAEECQNVLNLKHDTAMIQHADCQHLNINTIRTTKPQFAKRVTQPTPNKTPPSPYKHCGAWHFHRDCQVRVKCCQLCKKIGHKDGSCQNPPSSSQ